MGISFSNNFDDIAEAVNERAGAAALEKFAQGLADRAKAEGLESVDDISLDINQDARDLGIDEATLRDRANKILRQG